MFQQFVLARLVLQEEMEKMQNRTASFVTSNYTRSYASGSKTKKRCSSTHIKWQ